jgi:hypothetical protein
MFLIYVENIYEKLKHFWESKTIQRILSKVLVITFLLSAVVSLLRYKGWINFGNESLNNPFFAIDISFTMLLIAELMSLIFILPKSVAKSVGKQFELLSLIYIRSAFKEFSHIHKMQWDEMGESVYYMFAYAFTAIAIFTIMGFVYKYQKHNKICDFERDQRRFIRGKKFIALLLLLAFIGIGVFDIKNFISKGVYLRSFHVFYEALIFSDILILLIALRYTLDYYKIFRYSAFVLATIFIRISLTVEKPYNLITGLVAAFFVLVVTITYNYFLPVEKVKQEN